MIKFVEVAKIEAKSHKTGSLSKKLTVKLTIFSKHLGNQQNHGCQCDCVTKKLVLQLTSQHIKQGKSGDAWAVRLLKHQLRVFSYSLEEQ